MQADPYSLPNSTTDDTYDNAAPELAGPGIPGNVFVEIYGAAVAYQLMQKNGSWGPERTRAPWVGMLGETCYGIRFRSAVAGMPAQVAAQFLTEGMDNGAPPSFTVTAAGAVTPVKNPTMIVSQAILGADVVIAATTEATANFILQSAQIVADGATQYRIEVRLPECQSAGATTFTFVLRRFKVATTVILGQQQEAPFPAAQTKVAGLVTYDTPPAGSWVYVIGAFRGLANVTVLSGAGGGGSGQPLPSTLTVSTV